MAFSHPALEAITWWDLVDGRWLGAPSGLVRGDFTPKPAYDALLRLIRREWWTPEQALTTDAAGRVTFRGFLGAYEVSAPGMRAAFDVRHAGNESASVRLAGRSGS